MSNYLSTKVHFCEMHDGADGYGIAKFMNGWRFYHVDWNALYYVPVAICPWCKKSVEHGDVSWVRE